MTPFTGLPKERTGYLAPAALAERRAAALTFPPAYPPHDGIGTIESWHGGVRCIELSGEVARATILYLHGGGYRIGLPEGWSGFAGVLAERLSARVVLPDYRLAPEHPFPAALLDAVAVLAALEGSSPLVIAGDSAGGGLAAAATLAARRIGIAVPRAAVLISPWLDLTLSASTFVSNAAHDRFFPRENAAEAADLYLQGHPATDPLASPLFADLAGFPPTLLFAGGEEGLLADATRFAEKLALAGASVEAHLVAGMQHTWMNFFPDLPETAAAFDAIARFVSRASD